jgi:hypothetical protein
MRAAASAEAAASCTAAWTRWAYACTCYLALWQHPLTLVYKLVHVPCHATAPFPAVQSLNTRYTFTVGTDTVAQEEPPSALTIQV